MCIKASQRPCYQNRIGKHLPIYKANTWRNKPSWKCGKRKKKCDAPSSDPIVPDDYCDSGLPFSTGIQKKASASYFTAHSDLFIDSQKLSLISQEGR